MTDIIFYFGAIVIIATFIGFLVKKFKDENNIDLSRHKWIILLYILLLIGAIVTWRIVYLIIISSTREILNHNETIQRVING
jgi:NADH:ubiquinone oxidoreductase subunit 6 (subunit J)